MEKLYTNDLLISLAQLIFKFAIKDSVIIHNICYKHLDFAEKLNS